MTLRAYWWKPTSPATTLVRETAKHGRAWAQMLWKVKSPTNFGDAVGPLILTDLLARRVVWSRIESADVVAVGSLLNAYSHSHSQAQIFGSGVRNLHTLDRSRIPAERVIGVRGHATAEALGGTEIPVIGDPGLWVANLVRERRHRSGALVVPHFAALGTSLGRAELARASRLGARVALPNQHPLEIAVAVAASDIVLTSSLHALVFADALGVPAQLVSFDPGASEPPFKYDDYSSVFGVPSPIFMDIPPDLSPRTLAQHIDTVSIRSETVREQLPRVLTTLYDAAGPLR